jgi:hypothetical protein
MLSPNNSGAERRPAIRGFFEPSVVSQSFRDLLGAMPTLVVGMRIAKKRGKHAHVKRGHGTDIAQLTQNTQRYLRDTTLAC